MQKGILRELSFFFIFQVTNFITFFWFVLCMYTNIYMYIYLSPYIFLFSLLSYPKASISDILVFIFFPLNITSWKSFHINLQVSFYSFYNCILCVCVIVYTIVQSLQYAIVYSTYIVCSTHLLYEHLGGFQYFATANNASMNKLQYMYINLFRDVCLRQISIMGIMVSKGKYVWNLLDLGKLFCIGELCHL